MKNIIFSLILCLFGSTLYAQDEAEEAFLKSFPALQVGKTIGEKEYRNALQNHIKSETIAQIDYKKLLYNTTDDISKWVIMPIGKYKVAEGVYLVLYFSAFSGLSHTDTDCGYMLNLALLDFKQNKRIGNSIGNDGEYIVMSKTRRNSLIEMLGKDTPFTTQASFTFALNSPTKGTLKSKWEYSKGKSKNTTYKVNWSSTSFQIE